jgi:DnaK suppressor protein
MAKKVKKAAKKPAKANLKKATPKKSAPKSTKSTSKKTSNKVSKTKPKPAAKKVVAKESTAKKPTPKKVEKPVSSQKETSRSKKEAKGGAKEKDLKKTKPGLKPEKSAKESAKKPKVLDDELETEELDLGDDIEGLELDADADTVEDDLIEDDIVKQKPKRKGGRRRKDDDDDDHVFDSDNLIRKQQVKIDLNRQLIKKSQAPQPKPFVNNNDKRTRYSDKELAEFKELILDKLKEAEADYDLLKNTLSNRDNHGTDDTSPTFKLLEDGSSVMSKEETAQLASRQEKYIISLRNALIRIENKSYGVCRVTGKLIPKERLRSVPHATLGIDAKLNQNN